MTQIGGDYTLYTTLCQDEGILLQKYRNKNGRCAVILSKSIGVRDRFDAPDARLAYNIDRLLRTEQRKKGPGNICVPKPNLANDFIPISQTQNCVSSRPPKKKNHAQNSRPELSASLSNFTLLNPKCIQGDFLLTGETNTLFL